MGKVIGRNGSVAKALRTLLKVISARAGDRLTVGLVRGVHGRRGAVRVEIPTDRPEDRFRCGRKVFREGTDEPLTVLAAYPDDPGWLVRFDGLRDRTAAEALRDAYLEV